MSLKIIAQGAEAIITLNNNQIIKNRIKKSYRIPILDEKLRKTRTRSEAKIINKLNGIIPVPKIIKREFSDSKESELASDEKQKITMELIKGKKLSDNLESLDYKKISKILGEEIAKMHNKGIIHGDLTTSNMIYTDNIINPQSSADSLSNASAPFNNISLTNKSENSKEKVYFIDFGLAFHSKKIEDKAVDLHLLQQALESRHYTIYKECINIILENYEKTANQSKDIIHRIKVIESRGRYREKF